MSSMVLMQTVLMVVLLTVPTVIILAVPTVLMLTVLMGLMLTVQMDSSSLIPGYTILSFVRMSSIELAYFQTTVTTVFFYYI